eukprot:s90_g26.t1
MTNGHDVEFCPKFVSKKSDGDLSVHVCPNYQKTGVCQCLRGPCNEEGICVSTLPPEQQKDFLPPAPAPSAQTHVIDHMEAGQQAGGIPVVPIAIALVLANVVIWGAIWCIRQRRSRGYDSMSSDDEGTPMAAYKGGNNRRFQGPGH